MAKKKTQNGQENKKNNHKKTQNGQKNTKNNHKETQKTRDTKTKM